LTWANWTSYTDSVVAWLLNLFPVLLSAIMGNPLLGVPAILVIVGLVFNLVLKFIGSLSNNGKSEN